ncbi:MAG: hypothetical protein ACLQVL_19825 [Terriglobia bacterium]
MRNRLTALEIAEAEHPGILLKAKQALDRGKSSLLVAGLLNREFSLSLTKSTVEKYRKKRWQVQRDNLSQQKEDFHDLASQIKDGNLNEAAKALLFQSVRQLDPHALLGIMRINVQRENLRLKKKALRDLAKTNEPLPQRTPEEQQAAIEHVSNAMRAIFGIGEFASHDAWPQGRYLLKGECPVAQADQKLSPILLDCAYRKLCRPEGFHGIVYDGPNQPQAIARLKDLYALEHIPWPGDPDAMPQVQEDQRSDRDARSL